MNISENNPLVMEEAFFSSPFYLSYSSLKKLLYSPSSFYSYYVLKERVEKTSADMVSGRLLHLLILEGEEKVSDSFVITPKKLPKDRNKELLDKIFRRCNAENPCTGFLKDFKDEILEELKALDYHQSLSTDEQRLDKIITEENELYFEFLKEQTKKTIISEDTYHEIVSVKNIIINNESIKDLLKNEKECYREFHIKLEPDNAPFGMQGYIDHLALDRENKKVIISDLKKISKALIDFPETLEYYNYGLQAAFYTHLVKKFFGLDHSWDIQFQFVVVDLYNQVFTFRVSEKTMTSWTGEFKEALSAAKFHFARRDFTVPYLLLTGGGYL